MNWKDLNLVDALETIADASKARPQLIFKHSTRCGVSTMAKKGLEKEWNLDQVDPWYLDLLNHRPISQMIESRFNVLHESPQAILFINGAVAYHASHSEISVDDIRALL